jgi:hypothetical protein
MTIAQCLHCGDEMQIIKVDKFNKPHGITMITAGILFLTLIPTEAILGLALIPFGIFIVVTKKEVWHCPSCSTIVDKMKGLKDHKSQQTDIYDLYEDY